MSFRPPDEISSFVDKMHGLTKLLMDENSLPVVQFVFSSARPLGYE